MYKLGLSPFDRPGQRTIFAEGFEKTMRILDMIPVSERWSDAVLDAMRRVGDPPGDAAIREWRTAHPEGMTLRGLADTLVGFNASVEVDRLIALLEHSPEFMASLDPRTQRAECTCSDQDQAAAFALFEKHGLMILMILAFYSLPAAYAAQNGVRVLHSKNGSTGYLVKDLNRRLIETAQFVIQMCSRNGLSISESGSSCAHGPAVLTALRVRLLHAAVRALIQGHVPRWDGDRFGLPANQEDEAGTLMTFSWVVIDGLRKLHLDVDPAEEKAYFEIWRIVARLLGVAEPLIPANLEEAEILMKRIKARQIDAPILHGVSNDFGKEMTRHLLEFMRHALPLPLRPFGRLPASVMRFFLPDEPVDVAGSLGVPRTWGLDEFVRFWFWFEAHISRYKAFDTLNRLIYKEWGGRDPRAKSLLHFSRFLNKRLVARIVSINRNQFLEGAKELHVDLMGWEQHWDLHQADFLVRGARRVARRFRRRS
jgi:hypothetical protein